VRRRFEENSAGFYPFGDCEVDFDRAEIRRGGQPVDVTALNTRLSTGRLGRWGCYSRVLATIVVVATKRWAMLSTATPKPSSVLTPSRIMSLGSANTTSSIVS